MPLVPMDQEREKELVLEARTSMDAFAELYDYYVDGIYGYVLRRVGNASDAEDITARTFEKALGGIGDFKWKGASFCSWLVRIAANCVIDHYRREGRAKMVDLEEVLPLLEASDNPTSGVEREEERRLLLRAIHGLPERYRTVIELKFVDDLDSQVIADTIGCTKGNLAVRLHRALKALRREIERLEKEGLR
ncbi:MAG: sigma-70 family RNA polymerase sigma factor [Actinomycetota bacterium]|nr:sigma-70 family RNA polymerase sigma factor [Actinomycetota bacterium]MDD5666958.1 sigma-70 family RNA polymerase sigma factor [Actinomycetota bacterium]